VVGLLAGVAAGLATAAVAGQRRSMSAASRLAAVTMAADGTIRAFDATLYAELDDALADDPDVVAHRPMASSIGRTTVTRDWYYPIAAPATDEEIARPLMRSGRMPSPASQNEVAISAATAESTGLGVGSVVELDLYTNAQMERISSATEDQPLGSRVGLEVVGIVADTADVAPLEAQRRMLASDAFYRRITTSADGCGSCDNAYRGIEVRTKDGAAGFDRVAERLTDRFGPGRVDVEALAEAERAAGPSNGIVRTGTWIMAAVVIAVGGVVLAQLVRRQLVAQVAEESTLHCIGFTRGERTMAAVGPSALSAGVAMLIVPLVVIAVSPLFPIGRARLLEPAPGVDLDLVVVSIGAVLAGCALMGLVALVSNREMRRRERRPVRPARWLVGALPSLPPAIQTGLRVATGPDRPTRSRAFRAAVLGGAVGTIGLVASLVVLHSLDQLVETPSMYGVDADLSIEAPKELIDERAAQLARDPELEAVVVQWSTIAVTVDGHGVRAVALDPVRGSTDVVTLDGRGAVGPEEVVLGPELARDLGVIVGDEVDLGGNRDVSVRAVVVGIGLDPQVMSGAGDRVAVVARSDLARLADPTQGQDPYPIITVRFAPDVDPATKVAELDERFPYGVMDESHPSPPALLVALGDVRAVPIVFVWFFGLLALVAVLNGIVVAGRQARHELGVVRSLGFTGAQVMTALVVAAVTISVTSLLVGVPVGLLLGAATWVRVAEAVHVLPSVSVPVAAVIATVPAMAAVSVLGALWSARWVSTRRPADVLRVE